jgi:hypothetical protein
MKGWQKWVYLLFGLALCGFGIVIANVLLQQKQYGLAALMGILPLAPAIYLLALALRSRLTIDGTRIEVRGAFREKSADRSEVEGFRTINTRNGTYWRLELKQGRGSINIMQWFGSDELNAWFQPLTDLDERDRKQLLSEIEQDQELGATAEDRLKALNRAKTWNIGLSAIAVIAALGMLFGGAKWQSPGAVVLTLIPLAVLYSLNAEPLLYALGKSRRDPRNELSIALFAAAMGFLFGGIRTHFVSVMPLLPATATVALAFIVAFYMLGRKGPRTQGFHAVLLMCAASYSFGLIANCDTLLDNEQATPYQAQVANKHTSSGRSTTYYLDFDAWGPFKGANSVSVPESVYGAAQPGDTVCFLVYPGALHAAWFERVACEGPRDLQTTP